MDRQTTVRQSGRNQRDVGVAIVCTVLFGFSGNLSAMQQVDTPPRAAGLCIACHGINGNSFKPNYPKLAGQPSIYLIQQLTDFQEGRRKDPNMSVIAAGLSRNDIIGVASFFSRQNWPSKNLASSQEEASAEVKQAAAATAPCLVCHQSHFVLPNQPPHITGQLYSYLVKQLRDFRSARRVDEGRVMVRISASLTDSDITNIAAYLEGLPR